MKRLKLLMSGLCFLLFIAVTAQPTAPLAPDQVYGELFREVQMQRIFPDGKTFVDCMPKRNPKDILHDYEQQKGPQFNLKKFVEDNFDLPVTPQLNYVTKEKDIVAHIKSLWNVLKRQPDTSGLPPTPSNGGGGKESSLLPLPYPYI